MSQPHLAASFFKDKTMRIFWELPGHSQDGVIDADVLATPLPADRHFDEAGATYGDYVEAVATLLEKREVMESLCDAVGMVAGEVAGVAVAILKHGHFYHPAKITLENKEEEKAHLVINLAVTPEAEACLEREFEVFGHLTGRSDSLPCMFLKESLEHKGRQMMAMVGEWLEGYWEFHQTETHGEREVVVWAGETHRYISGTAESLIYSQAAEILTELYNPLTFEAVQPWHHAAGDFVVNISGETPDVKLITVRQYTPMIELDEVEPEDYLEGTLFFLMLLSIRNRLDRLDGIGEAAWVEGDVVKATVDGFFKGLSGRVDIGPFEGSFAEWVCIYLKKQDKEDLLGCAGAVIGSLNPGASEMALISEKIQEHISELAAALSKVDFV